MYCREVRGG
jgi:hypothetical protein